MAPVEEHEDYDASIPTPSGDVVTLEADPNPQSGDLPDAPPAGYQFADGAINPDTGHMLDADGNVVLPKQADAVVPQAGE